MQVAGQPAVSYGYDNASRLTQISQSSSTTGLGYDNADRRTSLTLPNNVVVSYSYNNDSRITGITYQYGSNTLGNLTYTYDQLSRRTQVGGSFARTGLPGAVASASYDAANELNNWNGIRLSYDANGNMLSDGSNNLTWNARNQVATLNNVSLQYDAFGRRAQNLAGASFLFDGANAVQELSGTTVTANELGGAIDEIFSRTDSSGAFAQLKDALGSTIALVDSNGNVQTAYTYDPFGNTSVSGASNANVFQYTGREYEGNGLYFYRTRYYSPLLHRFISEDPLGFTGSGPNFYAYAANGPTNFRDATGRSILPCGLESYLCDAAGNSHKSTRGDTFSRPNWLQCLAMDLVGGNVSCVQGPNGPIVTVQLPSGMTVISAYGGLNPPPFRRLHSDETTMQDNASGYNYWNSKSTEEIVNSFNPDSGYEPLLVKPDGTIMNGNTRIMILQQRGVDVNSLGLPTTIYEPEDPFIFPE